MMVWLMPATISFLLVSLVLFISILSASWMNVVQLISGSVFMTCLISPVGHCLVIMYLIFISHLAQWVGVLVGFIFEVHSDSLCAQIIHVNVLLCGTDVIVS